MGHRHERRKRQALAGTIKSDIEVVGTVKPDIAVYGNAEFETDKKLNLPLRWATQQSQFWSRHNLRRALLFSTVYLR